jgi:flagellar hook-associated protein 1
MGLSAAMQIGKNGLTIYQVASEVTSENIANVNTEGYSRQRVILESAPPTTHNGFPLGTGVRISTVERYYDKLLQQQLSTAATTSGYDSTKSEVLQEIEPSFNELTQDGLGSAISNFFGAWQDLSTNPSGTTERQVVLSQAQTLVDNFKSISTTLNNAITTQNAALPTLTDEINNKLTNIAALNGQIKQTELVSGNANEMRDQRDQLVKELSQQIGINYTENSDGTTDITFADGGGALVTGQKAGSFSLTTNTTTNLYDVNLTPAGGTTAALVTPTQGELGATLAMRDSTTSGIPYYLGQLNSLASSIITQVNTQHALGYDSGTPPAVGGNFFSGTNASDIAVNITDPSKIAAASSAATSPGGNANALVIANLQSTFTTSYNTLVSKIGLDTQQAKTVVSQDEAFTKQLSTLRDSNSGVSLDEELTNLVMYQRSYQASAKLITTATDMMDIVIGMIK